MRTGMDLLGLPVVNLVNGEVAGEVKRIHYCLATRRLTGLTVTSSRGSYFLPRRWLVRIGEDAVFFEQGPVDNEPVGGVSPPLHGLAVYTRSGIDVGTVDDIVIDDNGWVVGLNISGGLWHDLLAGHQFIPFDQATLGKNTVIVNDEAVQEDECSS